MSFQFTVSVDTRNDDTRDSAYGAPDRAPAARRAPDTRVIGGFSDVTGLGAETEVQPLRVGGLNDAEVMLPGPTKFPARLVLKRGLGDPALWKWYLDILYGAIKRQNVTIELGLGDGRKAAWTFREACPVKWSGPELHAGTSAVAFETVELVHRGFLAPSIEQAHRGSILSEQAHRGFIRSPRA
jgi:phage tail-like protein